MFLNLVILRNVPRDPGSQFFACLIDPFVHFCFCLPLLVHVGSCRPHFTLLRTAVYQEKPERRSVQKIFLCIGCFQLDDVWCKGFSLVFIKHIISLSFEQ